MIVARKHRPVVCIGADNRDTPEFFRGKGQNPVVFQQCHGFSGCFPVDLPVFLTIVGTVRDGVKGFHLVKHAQPHARGHQADDGAVDQFLGNLTLFHRCQRLHIYHAAVDVAAPFQCQSSRFLRRLSHLMMFVKIQQSPAVGDIVALKPPFPPKDILHQQLTGTAGFAVGAVVSTHHCLYFSFGDAGFKGWQIGFPQVLWTHLGVEFMAQPLRTAVHREMLGTGSCFQVLGILSLNALDKFHAQPAGEIGILSIGFLAAPPTGIPEDIDVGTPKSEPLIDIPIFLRSIGVVFCASLCRDHFSYFMHLLPVKHGGQTDGLGEDRSGAGAGHPVKRLVPPVVGRNPQALYSCAVIGQLAGLFIQCHPGNQILCPLLKGESFV